MKKLFFLLVVISLLFLQVSAYAIAPQGCKTYTLRANTDGGRSAHAHVTTKPARIYAITVTATANGGFAQIFDTVALPYTKAYSVLQDSHYLTYPEKADVRVATANDTVHCDFPEGINIDSQLFVDVEDADIKIYYKE